MKSLSINDILQVEDKALEEVEVEEWNGSVFVRIMSMEERSELEDIFMRVKSSNKGTGAFRKEMLKRTLVNEDGSLMLDNEALAIQLMKKSSLAVEKLFEKACELNGFREKDVDTLKKK